MDDYETAFRRAKKAWERLDNLFQRREQGTEDWRAAVREASDALADLVKVEADRHPGEERGGR